MSGNSPEVKEACLESFRDLMAMPKEEFLSMVEAHMDGDIARMMLETGALDIWKGNVMREAINREIKANYAVFKKKLPDLLVFQRGKFALMRKTEIVQFLDSASDAYILGREKYPDGLFSIQEVTDIPVYQSTGDVTVGDARQAMARAFKADPDFRRTYVDNVACILMDRLEIRDKDIRDPVADEIIQMLFEWEYI